eukprot:Lankesteria_metandrocarpae@DN1900_c0_g1_i1.p1
MTTNNLNSQPYTAPSRRPHMVVDTMQQKTHTLATQRIHSKTKVVSSEHDTSPHSSTVSYETTACRNSSLSARSPQNNRPIRDAHVATAQSPPAARSGNIDSKYRSQAGGQPPPATGHTHLNALDRCTHGLLRNPNTTLQSRLPMRSPKAKRKVTLYGCTSPTEPQQNIERCSEQNHHQQQLVSPEVQPHTEQKSSANVNSLYDLYFDEQSHLAKDSRQRLTAPPRLHRVLGNRSSPSSSTTGLTSRSDAGLHPTSTFSTIDKELDKIAFHFPTSENHSVKFTQSNAILPSALRLSTTTQAL